MNLRHRLYKEAQAREPERRARAKEETARAIVEAKKLDDATFGPSSQRAPIPQTDVDVAPQSGQSAVPESASSPRSNPIRAVVTFFGNNPFCGIPTEHPPVIFATLGKWSSCLCCFGRYSAEQNVAEDEKDGLPSVATEQPRARGLL